MKNRLTAGILAILLGGIGVHKFYLEQHGLGILYLLFFWTFIPAIVGLIEGIMFLTMTDQDFNAKYNPGAASPPAPAPTPLPGANRAHGNGQSVARELQELKALRDSGDLTEAEFQEQRERLLSSRA